MLPMLKQERFIQCQEEGRKRCKKYDIILYRRPPGQLCPSPDSGSTGDRLYVVLGDNCVKKYGITDEDILGVMTSFAYNGKTYQADDHSIRCMFLLVQVLQAPHGGKGGRQRLHVWEKKVTTARLCAGFLKGDGKK